MANTLTAVILQIWALGVQALRQNAIMPYLLDRSYEPKAYEKGNVVNVDLPYAVTPYDVSPSHTAVAGEDITPTQVQIAMNNWKGVGFHITDKEQLEMKSDFVKNQTTECVKALVNLIDVHCLTVMYPAIYGYSGTAGTTPFADIAKVSDVSTVLDNQLCPDGARRMVCNSNAYNAAANLEQLASMDYVADKTAMIEGTLGIRKGFSWWKDQNVPIHTAGTGANYVLNGAGTAGDTDVAVDTGSGTVLVGDIVVFAGHTQTYAVTVGIAAAGTVTITPALKEDVADGGTMTLKATHVLNLAFDQHCAALISRPLKGIAGELSYQALDPVSGIVLRVEIIRQNKRIYIEFDALYGAKLIRPELGSRIAG